MQSGSEPYFDVVELAKELRSEKLFVQSELDSIRNLNDRLERSAIELAQATWTSTQQRSNLKQLFAQGDPSSTTCCQRIDCVLSPVFVDAHKVLRYQDALILSDLIQRVRASPSIVSLWLAAAESRRPTAAAAVARVLCSGLYVYDVSPLRRVLYYLAKHRLAISEDPRRIISQGSSSFSRLYCELVDGLRPARLFLAAALKGPMLPLLQIDECLIIDPDKALERVKKLVKSSDPNADLQNQFSRYRKWTVSTLVTSTIKFISSLRELWLCFPPTIAWVVRQTALALQSNQQISEEDIHSICTNLIFTNFICQAIVNPEAYGISDIPITNISRFNLVQVAQTIQTLCLMKYQEVDGKFRDFYQRFEKDSVYSLIDILLENDSYSAIPNDNFGYNGSESGDTEDGISEGAACESEERDVLKTDPVVNPNIALFTRNDLHLLVSLLKVISNSNTCSIGSFSDQMNCLKVNNSSLDSEDMRKEKSLKSDNVTDRNKKIINDSNNHSDCETACGISSANDYSKLDNPIDFFQDEEFSPLLKCINPDLIMRIRKLLEKLPDSSFSWDNSNNQKPNGSVSKGKFSNSNSPMKNGPKKRKPPPQSQEVLIIKLPGDTSYEPIGLIPENRVLEYHYSTMVTCRTLSEEMLQHDTGLPNSRSMELLELPRQDPGVSAGTSHNNQPTTESSGPHPGQEKRTRFSLSHDEGSIGNTSDNLEAVSEAASNHSVTSSLEMETEDQNDNLSDMVSANVSGRGSPNISGRDTPSSQVTEGDAGVSLANPQPLRQPSVTFGSSAASKQAKLLKRTRHDIEDKFCKFEIRKLIEGDETISIISDTWSTDVLASDSETIGESTYDRNFIITHFGHQNMRSVGQSTTSIAAPSQPDISETASESAWSTDVLVDIDDCNSVTRSESDTARSEETPASARNSNSYSNQLSPINNNDNSMACNNMHIGNLPIVDILGPSERMNGSLEPTSLVGCSNCSPNDVPSASRTSGSSLVSPIRSALNPSNFILTGNNSNNDNLNLQEDPENFPTLEQTNDMHKINGPIEANGFVNYSDNSNILPNLSSDSKLLSNHAHTVDIINSFKLANGNSLNSPEIDRFDFNVDDKSFIGECSKNIKSDMTSSMADRNTADNTTLFSNNGSATIRWLNDPCQEFPLCPDADQSANQMYFDYDSSCTEVINEFCKKIENIDLNKPETSFRPIKVEKNSLDNSGSSEKHILDNKNNIKNFSNKEKRDCTYKGDTQKTYPLMTPNLLDSHKLVYAVANSSKESDFKECKPLHPFANFNTDGPLKVNENGNSNRLNVGLSNKKIDSPSNRICEEKTDSSLNDVISSGSAISLSTLSVNSVDTSTSDKSSSQEVNSENLTERRITPPLGNVNSVILDVKNHNIAIINDGANTLPRQSCTLGTNLSKLGSSTGAIPKSISFDSTAEKTHRYSGRRIIDDSNDGLGINFGELKNNVKRSGGNLLNKIKLFRNKSRGPTGNMSNYGKRPTQESSIDCSYKSGKDYDLRPSAENNRNDNINLLPGTSINGNKSNSELSDDILAKYRRKVSSSSDAATSDSTSHSGSIKNKNQGSSQPCDNNANISDVDSQVDRNSDLEYEGLRRELRLVLSNMEIQNIELAAGRSGSLALACALRLEGAGGALGALSALGNLGSLDSSRAPSLLNALRADTVARRPYISYLAKCRKSLLSTLTMLENEFSWQTNETQRQSALAVSARARASLASREPRLVDLQEKLRSGLVDERREALTAALNSLFFEMVAEESWSGSLPWELEQAALTIERVVMARVYIQAMFPNGDGDIMRDQLLHEHMTKLGSNGVGLPTRRLPGSPWVPAQRILAHLPAYRTPRDKVDCIVRCVNSIMTLLSMSSDSSTPGADDLTPALVYILIKANPPSLLSTIQFVTTFINAPLEGERLYCWTQFCAAVEYIKTID